VLYDPGFRILVINKRGEAWAHNLSCTTPLGCAAAADSVGAGYQLSGPGLFGTPNDKYVVAGQTNSYVLVINTAGEVWAHNLSRSTIGPGIKLNGPGLFGVPNDKYVVVYRYQPPQ
jgi:hypothetical protein